MNKINTYTAEVKLYHGKSSSNADLDLNENSDGSTDCAKKQHGLADLRTPIYPIPLRAINYRTPKKQNNTVQIQYSGFKYDYITLRDGPLFFWREGGV